jgi:cobalamin biosynthesis Mg chelatase CobN
MRDALVGSSVSIARTRLRGVYSCLQSYSGLRSFGTTAYCAFRYILLSMAASGMCFSVEPGIYLSRRVTRWTLRVGVLGLSIFALVACGPGEPATAATTPTTATNATPTQTVTQTQTVTAPSKTTTVTAPTQTNTVIKTQTVTAPTTTSTSRAPGAAAVGAAAAANKESSSESSGLPGWAWALIGAAVAGAVIWIITLIRRGRKDGSPSDGTGGPGALGGGPPPNTPPRA